MKTKCIILILMALVLVIGGCASSAKSVNEKYRIIVPELREPKLNGNLKNQI